MGRTKYSRFRSCPGPCRIILYTEMDVFDLGAFLFYPPLLSPAIQASCQVAEVKPERTICLALLASLLCDAHVEVKVQTAIFRRDLFDGFGEQSQSVSLSFVHQIFVF